MRQKPTALFFSLFLYCTAFAETFVVTSNADSGPGTLRWAIEAAKANGITTPDQITFNIPGALFQDHIIRLIEELPSLSANLTIDGTSQPGTAYGTTDARVCLLVDEYKPKWTMLHIDNANDVNIYGLNLYYGYWEGMFSNEKRRPNELFGIKITRSSRIELGASQKGNVLNGFEFGVYSVSDGCGDISIRNNYMGIGGFYRNTPHTDIDDLVLGNKVDIGLYSCKNITIGGPHPTDGNVLSGSKAIAIDSRKKTGNGFVLVQHNVFSREYDKKTLQYRGGVHISIGRSVGLQDHSDNHLIDYDVSVLDNDIPTTCLLNHLSKPFIVKRNKFIISQRQNASIISKCAIENCAGGGVIGGENLQDANFFQDVPANDHMEEFGSVYVTNSGPVTIIKNVFECNSRYGSTIEVRHDLKANPFVQIDKTTPLSGRATPNSIVHLYYDDECKACEGKEFITSVKADADSTWIYEGTIKGTVVATATFNNYTGEFSAPAFFDKKMVIKHPTCGLRNGSITNIQAEGADSYFWLDYRTKDTVGKSLNLLDVGPGHYLLFGVHGGTCIKPMTYTIELEDKSPKVLTDWVRIEQPSCGKFNGSIADLMVSKNANTVVLWQQKPVRTGNDPLGFYKLAPGTYQLIAKDTISGCADTATFVLKNQSGPLLSFEKMQIGPSVCSQSNGSIKGIIIKNATGIPYIQWEDSLHKKAGSELNLENIPEGRYRLKFKDETSCDTIITPYYTISNNGQIRFDTADKKIRPASCTGSDGSISNITVSGAGKFTWIKTADNTIVATTRDASGLVAGTYVLKASNALGCSSTSPEIIVPQAAFATLNVTASSIQPATCSQNNGSVSNLQFDKNISAYSFAWSDSVTRQPVAAGIVLTNMAAGTYLLHATDSNGCKQEIFTAQLPALPKPVINATNVLLTHDLCGQQQGAVSGLKLENLSGPTTYLWTDAQGNNVGSKPDLQNISAGQYLLRITDAGTCIVQSGIFTIEDKTEALQTPVYADQVIPRHTKATLLLMSPVQSGHYQLSARNGGQVLQQNNSGGFVTGALEKDSTFYIRNIWGTCTSRIAVVQIRVVDDTKIYVPTGFTPNGDGKNDVLRPTVVGIFQMDYFTVFDRWGNIVFQSKEAGKGWDGKNKGMHAPAGVYVWIIRGKDFYGKTIGQKGSFMLLR